MSEIQVCLTDGTETWRVLAMQQNPKQEIFVAILGMKDKTGFHDFHMSYHVDGNNHVKVNKEIVQGPIKRIPLADIDTIQRWWTFALPMTPQYGEEVHSNLKRKKEFDHLVLIDVRGKKDLNIFPFFFNPEKVKSEEIKDFMKSYKEIHIIQGNPICFGVGIHIESK